MNEANYEERVAIYWEAIRKYGTVHQLNKFDEEMGEFLTELGRMRNGMGDQEKLAEEMADLTIMLEQLRLIYGLNEQVCKQMDFKVRRLQSRLEMEG